MRAARHRGFRFTPNPPIPHKIPTEVVHLLPRRGRQVDVPGDGVAAGEQGQRVEASLLGLDRRRALGLGVRVRQVDRHGFAQAEERLLRRGGEGR